MHESLKPAIPCYAFVEDRLSHAVLLKIVHFVNRMPEMPARIIFPRGFPKITNGNGELKKIARRALPAASPETPFIILTDLDDVVSPHALGREWFQIPHLSELPFDFHFRIAIREVESWVFAHRKGFARYMGFSITQIPHIPDTIPDPKAFLFNLIRSRGQKKWQKNMLPRRGQHIGGEYNPRMIQFVQNIWDVGKACEASPSLERTVSRLGLWLRHAL